jgi:ketosteroid isomerase-like protein
MSVLCAALWLALNTAQSEPTIRVDWSAAAGADSDVAAARRDFVRAVNAGDPAAESFYMTDAVGITPDRARATLTLVPRRFDVGKDTAAETGTYTEARADGAKTVEGLYVTVYTRGADNRWRVAMEVWSTGSLRRR